MVVGPQKKALSWPGRSGGLVEWQALDVTAGSKAWPSATIQLEELSVKVLRQTLMAPSH